MDISNSFVRELAGKFPEEEIQKGWGKTQSKEFLNYYGNGLKEMDGSPTIIWHTSTNLKTFDNFDRNYLYSAPGRGFLNLGAGFYFADYDHVKNHMDTVAVPTATARDVANDHEIIVHRKKMDDFNSAYSEKNKEYSAKIHPIYGRINIFQKKINESFTKNYPTDPFDENYNDLNTVLENLKGKNKLQKAFFGRAKSEMIRLKNELDTLNGEKASIDNEYNSILGDIKKGIENEQKAIVERKNEIGENNYAKAFIQPFLSNAKYLNWNEDIPEDLLDAVRKALGSKGRRRFDTYIEDIDDGRGLYNAIASSLLGKKIKFGNAYVVENTLPASDLLLSVGIGGNYSNLGHAKHCYVVFDEKSIKHAVLNNGNFDTTTSNFYK